jgi:hypothetical protein
MGLRIIVDISLICTTLVQNGRGRIYALIAFLVAMQCH